jgi:hypothetical protein
MPKAAQASRSSAKGEAIIKEVTTTSFQIIIPETGLLPERKCRPLSIWPGDDLDKVFPRDKKHENIRGLLGRIKPGSGKIDHVILMPGKKNTTLQIQLEVGLDTRGVRDRVESALKQAGYPPMPAI